VLGNDFPSLPPPPPKPDPKPEVKKKQENNSPNKKEQKEKKQQKEQKEQRERNNDKPVSFKEAEENPFQIKATKSQKTKKKESDGNKKMAKDFPALGDGSSTTGSILGNTEKKDELEERFGIKVNKNKKKGRK